MKIFTLFLFLPLSVFAGDVTIYGTPSGVPFYVDTFSMSSPELIVGVSPIVFSDFGSYQDGNTTLRFPSLSGDVVVHPASYDQVVVAAPSGCYVYAVPTRSRAFWFRAGFGLVFIPGMAFLSLRWLRHLTSHPASE